MYCGVVFSFHSVVNKIQVWCEEAVDITYHFFSFKMINPVNVAKIFVERASKLPSSTFLNTSTSGNTITNRECEVADLLCGVLESIANSHSHTFEVETTLDHEPSESELINEGDDEIEVEEMIDPEWTEKEDEEDKELRKEFSFDYMKRAVNFYDEINPKTNKRKRRWETVKHNFQRIPHQTYIARFRHYLERHGTKKQKLDQIDDYVFDMFDRARESSLPVHDIDLRRWALKKAMDESLHNFVASSYWLYNFKCKHNIISRKVTKVRNFLINSKTYDKKLSFWTTEIKKIVPFRFTDVCGLY
jgi:hypothetical protein